MLPTDRTSAKSRSSSASSTPPSETSTIGDELMVSEALPPRPRLANVLCRDSQQIENKSGGQNESDQVCAKINTDWDSSAAEDVDNCAWSKYKVAEHALLSYSRTNQYEQLQSLLEAKHREEIDLKLNYKGQHKQNFSWTALHLACYFGHTRIVELLLSRKKFKEELDVNIQNNSGDTPLHKAALTKRSRIVQLLLANGANVFFRNCDGLLAKQLTNDKHILEMLEAAEQVDKNRIRQELFKTVDNGDLKRLQEFFDSYGLCMNNCRKNDRTNLDHLEERVEKDASDVQFGDHTSENVVENVEYLTQMTDDRGNTLLHLAAMRGFKAISIYLLEQGLNPYKKNNLGQTCIDLSSYQLRQLFSTVKPTNSQLKKLSTQRLTRFEGPLMKKVRILGWKPIYVVLENGVILLFNNRKDSMNKSRRGYKYLESATCEPEPNDLGTFTICFSDKSRASFLVTTDQLNNYNSFMFESDKSKHTGKQVELVRQRWIDSIRDHIRYSTDFIKRGLNFNDYDDEDPKNASDIASMNHLLPIDTIKSFVQEARAHYNILERHAESLCSLVQSINKNNTNRLNQSFDLNRDDQSRVESRDVQHATTTTSTGSRLFGLIRPSRQARGNSISGDDGLSVSSQQTTANLSTMRLNNSLTNEFAQDNWHCILFHLKLLIESTENTKTSMGQALTLMEHQEELRQNRIQDQEERCRVLEDSLHALARDHHELEKSVSMSQIYHSAAARSMSMSTDLNEYFDAFEDFDDEKTMTPNSMPSDEDLSRKIQDVMEEEELALQPDLVAGPSGNVMNPFNDRTRSYDITDDEEDDSRSNCSALTIETISDQYADNNTRMLDGDENPSALTMNPKNQNHRTRLPSTMVPRDQVSIWSILKNCIGKELSKITMPVVFNEPLTMLQRACEGVQYAQYLKRADESDDPVERMELICAFIVAGLSANCNRIIKPFNPLLYETYEIDHQLEDGSYVRAVAQQVSHHPPITAAYCESDNFIYNGSVNPKIKFWGKSIEVQPDGQCRIFLKRHQESYVFKSVPCLVHNIIVGKLWFEHVGPFDIRCLESNMQAHLVFKQTGWFSNDLHKFDGVIVSSEGNAKKLKYLYGKWSDYINSVNYAEYESFMRESQQKIFRIPDSPDSNQVNGLISKVDKLSVSNSQQVNNNNSKERGSKSASSTSLTRSGDKRDCQPKGEQAQLLDIPNAKTIWRLESQYLEEYYNFTLFTMKLNELTPALADSLPRTDSRFRPDVRKLEEGDLDGAASEKQRLEEKQREARSKDKRFKEPSPDFLWFDLTNVPFSKEKFWIYKGGYWENKNRLDKFPDLF